MSSTPPDLQRLSDNAELSAIARSTVYRPDEDLVGGVIRLVRALGRRFAVGDPDTARYLSLIRDELEDAYARAVAGWRTMGFSDSQIGRELGVTKQAVAKRWPRSR